MRLVSELAEAEEKTEQAAEQAEAQAPAASEGGDGRPVRVEASVKAAWNESELSLLIKAANKFPGGVPNRWLKMAEFINHMANPCNQR